MLTKSSRKKVDLTEESINTKIIDDTSAKAFLYDERYNFTDVFIDQAVNYDSSNWKDYTILEQDSILKSKFKLQIENNEAQNILNLKRPEHKQTFKDLLVKFVMKSSSGFSIYYSPFITNISNVNIKYSQNNVIYFSNNSNIQLKIPTIIYATSFNYFFKKDWSIGVESLSSLKRNDLYVSHSLGLSWRKNIKKTGKPIFIQPGMYITYGYYGTEIGQLNNTGNFSIDDNKITSKTYNIYLSERQTGLKSSLSLLYPLTHFFKISLNIAYQYNFLNTNIIYINNKSGDIYPAKIPTNTQGLDINVQKRNNSNNYFQSNRFLIGLSLYLDLL